MLTELVFFGGGGFGDFELLESPDPVQAFRGHGKGGATARLLNARKQDRARE